MSKAPRTLVEGLRARGVDISVDGDRLRIRGAVSAVEQRQLRAMRAELCRMLSEAEPPVPEVVIEPPPVSAADALEEVLREDREREEAAQRELVEAGQRRHAERQRRLRLDQMATWDEQKVRALVGAGRLTADDVREWHEARDERLHRAAMEVGAAMFGASIGRSCRLVDLPGVGLVAVVR